MIDGSFVRYVWSGATHALCIELEHDTCNHVTMDLPNVLPRSLT